MMWRPLCLLIGLVLHSSATAGGEISLSIQGDASFLSPAWRPRAREAKALFASRWPRSEAAAAASAAPAKGIPQLLHIVAEECSQKLVDRVQGLASFPNGLGFEVRCHGAGDRAAYVRERLPDYRTFYDDIPLSIMKADVFRYMVLYLDGGFYVDDDVELYPGFQEKVLRRSRNASGLVVGWERHQAQHLGEWCFEGMGMLCNSIATYAVGAPKGDVRMKDVLDTIKAWMEEGGGAAVALEASGARATEESQVAVIQNTGPALFTTRLLMHLHPEEVLGIEAFGCGQRHSSAPACDPEDSSVWLEHRFEKKWRK